MALDMIISTVYFESTGLYFDLCIQYSTSCLSYNEMLPCIDSANE